MLNTIAEVFTTLKDHINDSKHKDAAIDLLHTLIDTQGVTPKEIRESTLFEDDDVRDVLLDYDDSLEEDDDGLDTWGDEEDDDDTDLDEDDY
ncbi:hypothetical protein N8Z09_03935 [Methylophilaceae bacterium]|nr:hypothetical protein [Methylophilaceae bacterium]